jgi:hypothetical protein
MEVVYKVINLISEDGIAISAFILALLNWLRVRRRESSEEKLMGAKKITEYKTKLFDQKRRVKAFIKGIEFCLNKSSCSEFEKNIWQPIKKTSDEVALRIDDCIEELKKMKLNANTVIDLELLTAEADDLCKRADDFFKSMEPKEKR